jgi:hypothetical protein
MNTRSQRKSGDDAMPAPREHVSMSSSLLEPWSSAITTSVNMKWSSTKSQHPSQRKETTAMQIEINEHQETWIELTNGKQLRLGKEVNVSLLEGGSLQVTFGDYKTTIYAPHAWNTIKIVDVAGHAAAILLGSQAASPQTSSP